jgi:DNA-binding transcriptional LysR family regulator
MDIKTTRRGTPKTKSLAGLDLLDFRMICAIEEECSLTHASQRLHLTLPAVSARVKNLENHFGIRLIYRERSGVRLTAAGLVFAKRARAMLQEATRLLLDLEAFGEGIEGQIRVFANTTAVTEFLPQVIQEYLRTRPNIAIDVRERLNADIVHAVLYGATDVGIVAGKVPLEGLEAIHFATDRLVVAVARNHPLSGLPAVPFHSTLDYPHITLDEGSTLFTFLAASAADLGRTIRVRTQVQSFDTMCRMIEADVGIGVLPRSCAERSSRNENIRLVELSDSWAVRERFVIVRSLAALPTYVQEFVHAVKKFAGTPDAVHSGGCGAPDDAPALRIVTNAR